MDDLTPLVDVMLEILQFFLNLKKTKYRLPVGGSLVILIVELDLIFRVVPGLGIHIFLK